MTYSYTLPQSVLSYYCIIPNSDDGPTTSSSPNDLQHQSNRTTLHAEIVEVPKSSLQSKDSGLISEDDVSLNSSGTDHSGSSPAGNRKSRPSENSQTFLMTPEAKVSKKQRFFDSKKSENLEEVHEV